MAETTKKTKTTAAKPRKPATRKKASAETPEILAASTVTPINGSVSYDEVARLAHRFYEERGHRHGHHVDDWVRAEQELLGKAS